MESKEKGLPAGQDLIHIDLTSVATYEDRAKLSVSTGSSSEDEQIRQSGESVGTLHWLIFTGDVKALHTSVLNDFAQADPQIIALNTAVLEEFKAFLQDVHERQVQQGTTISDLQYSLSSGVDKVAKDLTLDELAELKMRQLSPDLDVTSFDKMNSVTYSAIMLRDSRSELGRGIGHLANDRNTLEFLLKLCRKYFASTKAPQPFLSHQDANGDTPLHFHCRAGNEEVVQLMLNGSQADYEGTKLVVGHIATEAHNLDGETAIFDALRSKKLKTIKALLKHGVTLEERSEMGNSPLHIAAEYGVGNYIQTCLVGFEKLLETEGENEDQYAEIKIDSITRLQNGEGLTPLDLAIIEGEIDTVNELLHNTSYMDLEEQFEKHHRKVPLMHYALAHTDKKHLDIAALLHSYDVYMINKMDQSARETATFWVNATDKIHRNNALHVAAQKGNYLATVWLLSLTKEVNGVEKPIVDTTKTNSCDKIPLHLACENGMSLVAQSLYQAYFPSITRTTEQHKNPLELACYEGHSHVVGQLALEMPASTNHILLADGKQREQIGFQELLRHNVDIAQSPMQIAASEGRASVISSLFNAMIAKVFLKDPVEYPPSLSPLELAHHFNKPQAAKTYLAHEFAYHSIIKSIENFGCTNSATGESSTGEDNIRSALIHYGQAQWCGKTPNQFFEQEQKRLEHLIEDGLLPDGDVDDSGSLNSSGEFAVADDSDSFMDHCELVKGYQPALKKELARLTNRFDRLSFKEQLDRVMIMVKLQAILSVVNDVYLSKEKRAQFISEQYQSMKGLLKSETTKDAVKMICLIALGIIGGVAIGVTIAGVVAAFAAAPTALYIVACAISCGGGAALSYFGLFKGRKAHRQLNQLTLKQLEQNEPTISVNYTTL